jgi:hypothetical protein
MQLYRDPATGRFTDPPAGAVPLARVSAGANVTAAPLTARAAPGGGMMVRLDDRFHGLFTATVDAGHVRTSCGATADRR